jgi:hypothetical protein
MEGVGLMALEDRIKKELIQTYKVPEDLCEVYNQYYSEKILPCVREKFLAHLISVAEDLIIEKIKDRDPTITRRYRIILWKSNPKNGRATLRPLPYGAIITYNPRNDDRDLRIFVAHELGHLLCKFQVLGGGTTDNNANLFAYFAINGKNIFYKEKAPTLVFRGGELQIISTIQAACPIRKEHQS